MGLDGGGQRKGEMGDICNGVNNKKKILIVKNTTSRFSNLGISLKEMKTTI